MKRVVNVLIVIAVVVVAMNIFTLYRLGKSTADTELAYRRVIDRDTASLPIDRGALPRWSTRARRPFQLLIDQGSEERALAYYAAARGRLSLPEISIAQLLTSAGYMGLSPRQLERMQPSDLMDPIKVTQLASSGVTFGEDDILVTRYFAPKIVDVYAQPIKLGWRKLVRLRVLSGTPLHDKGVTALYLLFNFTSDDAERDPFEGATSQNTQGILTLDPARRTDPGDPAYWFVFNSLDNDASRGEAKTSFAVRFDLPDRCRDPFGGAGPCEYHVPDACADCHGRNLTAKPGAFPSATVNAIDTDWLFDRVRAGDLDTVPREKVLFDGGGDKSAPQFKMAFEVIRKINSEVAAHSIAATAANPLGDLISSYRAAKGWMQLHDVADGYVPPAGRGLDNQAGIKWDGAKPPDVDAVSKLSQYCYRCHATFLYNVFDKNQVLALRDQMIAAVYGGYMPADRILTNGEQASIINSLGNIR